MGSVWKADLHPRDTKGEFAKKPGGRKADWAKQIDAQFSDSDLSPALAEVRSHNANQVRQWWGALTEAERERVRQTIADRSREGISVHIGLTALKDLLSNGRLKSSHEIGTNRGEGYDPLRREYEDKVQGLAGVPARDRPISGTAGDPGSADAYGDIRVHLKDSVRSRTTASVGDSLNGATDVRPINDIPDLGDNDLLGLIGRVETQPGGLASGNLKQYMETQTPNVGLKDVASVDVPSDTPQSVLDALDKAGIPYQIMQSAEEAELEALRKKLGL